MNGYSFGQGDSKTVLIEKINTLLERARSAPQTGIRDNLVTRLQTLLVTVADAEEEELIAEIAAEVQREEGKVELLFGPPTSPPAGENQLAPSEKKKTWVMPVLMLGALGITGWIFFRTLRQPQMSVAGASVTRKRRRSTIR